VPPSVGARLGPMLRKGASEAVGEEVRREVEREGEGESEVAGEDDDDGDGEGER